MGKIAVKLGEKIKIRFSPAPSTENHQSRHSFAVKIHRI
jgi:hypothetical protein